MRRCFAYASLLLALTSSSGFAQAPLLAPTGPSSSEYAVPIAPPAADDPQQVRRELAAPLRNQFDALRTPANEEIKADVVTPEMWLYMQEMRRYDDPLQAVRRNAAARAAHRRARIAAMQWFGFSNTRPQANPMPFSDVYSPTWASNSWNPYTWIGAGNAWTAVRVEPLVITR